MAPAFSVPPRDNEVESSYLRTIVVNLNIVPAFDAFLQRQAPSRERTWHCNLSALASPLPSGIRLQICPLNASRSYGIGSHSAKESPRLGIFTNTCILKSHLIVMDYYALCIDPATQPLDIYKGPIPVSSIAQPSNTESLDHEVADLIIPPVRGVGWQREATCFTCMYARHDSIRITTYTN
jgi:hypothetical protein